MQINIGTPDLVGLLKAHAESFPALSVSLDSTYVDIYFTFLEIHMFT